MTINNITTARAASANGAGAGGGEAVTNPKGTLGQNDFLKLMIAQLQAQNPLEPSNANEYVNELAQLTQVEQTTNLANASELSSAVQLIGHMVAFNDPQGNLVRGKVESVQSAASGTTVTVEGHGGVKLTSIVEVN
jgi:flagellar basal-body rod modification protein FlgD